MGCHISWSVQGCVKQVTEKADLVKCVPAHSKPVGARWCLRYFLTQTILWLYDSMNYTPGKQLSDQPLQAFQKQNWKCLKLCFSLLGSLASKTACRLIKIKWQRFNQIPKYAGCSSMFPWNIYLEMIACLFYMLSKNQVLILFQYTFSKQK